MCVYMCVCIYFSSNPFILKPHSPLLLFLVSFIFYKESKINNLSIIIENSQKIKDIPKLTFSFHYSY